MDYLNMNDRKLMPIVQELNTLLADYNVYYQKLRNFHWNVVGKNFFDLHEKFEELYTDARIKIDEIAERILTLRFHPVSNFSDYLKISSLQEDSSLLTDNEMVHNILSDHRQLLIQMKLVMAASENLKDEGTLDIIGGYISSLEKSSWMLNAWTKNTEGQLKKSFVQKTDIVEA